MIVKALGFAAIGLVSFGLVLLLLRGLGWVLCPSPLTAKRLRRFREIRRGYWAFLLLAAALVASLFLELYVNDKPLYIRYGERMRFPALAQWLNQLPLLHLGERLRARDWGVAHDGELAARRFASWVRDPVLLDQHIETVKDEGARAGLVSLRQAIDRGEVAIVLPLHPYSPRESLRELPGTPPHKPGTAGAPLLGTDFAGKDVLAQLLYGFRISFLFALVVAALGYLIGVTAGALMGYHGGWIDILLQRVVEIWSSIPFLYTMMIIAFIVQPGFWLLALMLVLLQAWLSITYPVRGEYYREKARDYVQAARALGVSQGRIMTRHILPNALVPIITFLPFAIVGHMSALVSLDFLGFGLPPGTPSWGALLRQGAENVVNHTQLVIIPVLAFAGTLFAVVLIGEAVREAFDPRRYARLR